MKVHTDSFYALLFAVSQIATLSVSDLTESADYRFMSADAEKSSEPRHIPIILDEYILTGKLPLPCPANNAAFAGKLIYSRKNCTTNSFTLDIRTPNSSCSPLGHGVIWVYLNVRELNLHDHETLFLTVTDSISRGRLRKTLLPDTSPVEDNAGRQSYAQLTTQSSLFQLELLSSANSTCHKTSGQSTVFSVDYTYFWTAARWELDNFCYCPSLHGYIPAVIVCDEEFISCPTEIHLNSADPDPSLGESFSCNEQYDNCDDPPTSTTDPPPVALTTIRHNRTIRPYTWSPVQPQTTNDLQSTWTYVVIVLGVTIVILIALFGLFVYVRHLLQTRIRALAEAEGGFRGHVNMVVQDDNDDPPPVYSPPGAPPSYVEAMDGNLSVVFCDEGDRISIRSSDTESRSPNERAVQTSLSATVPADADDHNSESTFSVPVLSNLNSCSAVITDNDDADKISPQI